VVSSSLGTKHNYLTIIDLYYDKSRDNSKQRLVCKCDCGNIKDYYFSDVLHGRTHSCGCFKRSCKVNYSFSRGL